MDRGRGFSHLGHDVVPFLDCCIDGESSWSAVFAPFWVFFGLVHCAGTVGWCSMDLFANTNLFALCACLESLMGDVCLYGGWCVDSSSHRCRAVLQ